MGLIERAKDVVARSLKLKLVLLIVSLLALTIGIAPWSAIDMQRRQLLAASTERLESLEEKLEEVLKAYMLKGEPSSVQAMLEAAAAHGGVERLRILDPEGKIRFSSEPAEVGGQIDGEVLSRYVGDPHPLVFEKSGSVSHSLIRPLFNAENCSVCHGSEQKVLGLLQVSLSLDRTWEELAGLRWRAAMATLLTLGVIVVGIWVALSHFVDRPLRSLVAVMRRAESGDLSARVEISTHDELGQLGHRLNDMIAELEAAQAEVKEYHEEQLARADRLATLGQMAAAIAHEIRNPLTGISGAMSVLARGFGEDDPRRDVIRQARPLIDRLNKAVEDILLFARPSNPQFQTVRLDDVIDRAFAIAAVEAGKAGVRVVRDDSGVGAAPTLEADPVQLQSVLVNLIVNAVHASASGEEVRVRAGTAPNDGGPPDAVIEVEDRGKGMTAEEVENAFKPFFTTKAQGTGLGLAIARTLVQQHDGTISVQSAPGKGTCIQVRLPTGPRPAGEEA